MRRASLTTCLGLAMLVATPAVRAQQTDLQNVIPQRTLVHLAIDGLSPLQGSVTDLINAIQPGQGALAGLMFGQIATMPFMGEVDKTKPIYFTMLSAEESYFALPVASPDDFEALLKTVPGTEDAVVVKGAGYSLLARGLTQPVGQLGSARAAAPKLQGLVRGFVNIKDLFDTYGDQIESTLAMAAMMSGGAQMGHQLSAMVERLPILVPRLDFALVPSAKGFELAFSFEPTQQSGLQGFARSSSPNRPNKFLSVIPEGSSMVMAGDFKPSDLTQLFNSYFDLMFQGTLDEADVTKLQGMVNKVVATWDGQLAAAQVPVAGGVALVEAFGCNDHAAFRSCLKDATQYQPQLEKMMAAYGTGMKLSFDYKADAATVGGVKVDQIDYHITLPEDMDPNMRDMMKASLAMFEKPGLVAYPAGGVVLIFGGDKTLLEKSLTALANGATPPRSTQSLEPGKAFSMGFNMLGLIKQSVANLPPQMAGPAAMLSELPEGREFMKANLNPSSGSIEFRVDLPIAALKEVQQAVMSSMQPR